MKQEIFMLIEIKNERQRDEFLKFYELLPVEVKFCGLIPRFENE